MPIPSISTPHKIHKALLPLFIKHRPTATSSSPSFPLTENLPTPVIPPPPAAAEAPKLDFDDTERLYAAVESEELLRSLATLYAMAAAPAVDLATAVMRSKAVEENWAVRAAVMGAVRKTIYRQFCAGEAAEEAAETLRQLWKGGMRGILDYGLEDATDGAACDRNLDGFLSTVEMTETLPPSSVSFACVKLTAICPTPLLERVSHLLQFQQKHPSFPLPWKKPSLPILTHTPTPPHLTPTPPPPLTQSEQLQLHLSHHRLSTLCRRCAAAHLPLLVDAEYSSVQPAIDHIVYAAALDFNRRESPVIYGTIQAYLKDAEERLVRVVEGAERAGVSVGVKLVRGAYLSREIALACKMGVASPIHESVERTHACFDACAEFVLHKIAKGACSVVLATHNIDSGKLAAAKAEELGIRKGEQKLQFAQLMGMADGLSLALKNAGFQVSKYLPFGPVEQIMPYLVRRAEENRGVLSSSAIDRELLSKELRRRLRVRIFGR